MDDVEIYADPEDTDAQVNEEVLKISRAEIAFETARLERANEIRQELSELRARFGNLKDNSRSEASFEKNKITRRYAQLLERLVRTQYQPSDVLRNLTEEERKRIESRREAVRTLTTRDPELAKKLAGLQKVPGYLEESKVPADSHCETFVAQRLSKVPADSHCETFVALRTEVENWRWAGVPFYLRTGKRLTARDAQIVVNFRPVPHQIFPGASVPNRLVIKLQPEDGLELQLLAQKGTGHGEQLTPVTLDLDFDKAFATQRVGAYERLLLEAIAGRLNLFVRSDEQEQAWRWVEPILDAWAEDGNGPRPYAAGSWGPAAASALVARDGFSWAEEQ